MAAKQSNSAIPDRTATWLADIDPDLRRTKLAKLDLCEPDKDTVPAAESKPAAVQTVAAFIDGYRDRKAAVWKERTRNGAGQDRDSLIKFLGPDRPLDAVTAGDADKFFDWLRAEEFAPATIGRRLRRCSQFFRAACREKLITENPFDGIKPPSQENEERFYFVTRAETERLIEACPNYEWRLIVALSRFGGLRCPSETLALTWDCVDWDRGRIKVLSPKTEHHKGGASREIPLFPELRPYLQDAYDALGDEPGHHVIVRYRDEGTNLRTQMLRIIARAGLKPWERVFHNMRASRQNELAAEYPIHIVCRWLGNSALIANKHYLSGDAGGYFEGRHSG